VVADGNKDVAFAPNGELLVTDPENHRVCVFSADSDTLLRSWTATDAHSLNCTALALADNKLFVLDRFMSRAQVFV
jgi:hypothetical protein